MVCLASTISFIRRRAPTVMLLLMVFGMLTHLLSPAALSLTESGLLFRLQHALPVG